MPGYLQKKEVLKHMEEKGLKFEVAPRKNMKRLMSHFECYHIKHRSIIESDWGTLKNNFQLEYHKARPQSDLLFELSKGYLRRVVCLKFVIS